MSKHTVVEFSKDSVRIKKVQSEELAKYRDRKDCIVDPDLIPLRGIPPHNWVLDDGVIISHLAPKKRAHPRHWDLEKPISLQREQVVPSIKNKVIHIREEISYGKVLALILSVDAVILTLIRMFFI